MFYFTKNTDQVSRIVSLTRSITENLLSVSRPSHFIMGQSHSNAAADAEAAAEAAAAVAAAALKAAALYHGAKVAQSAIEAGVKTAVETAEAREKSRVEELGKELKTLLKDRGHLLSLRPDTIVYDFVRDDNLQGLEDFLVKYFDVPRFRRYLNHDKPIAEAVSRLKKDPAVYMPFVERFEGWLDRNTFLLAVEYGHTAMLEWCFAHCCSTSSHGHCFSRTVCWAFNGRDPVREAARHGNLDCLKAFHDHGFVFEKTVKDELNTFISETSDKIARFSKGWERKEVKEEVQEWIFQTEERKVILKWLSEIGASQ
jgi:hypothetical protein